MKINNSSLQFLFFGLFLFSGLFISSPYAQEADLPAAGNYSIVAEQSRIQIKTGTGGAFGFLGHGHIIAAKSFKGTAEVKPQESVPASISIQVDATSLHEVADFKPEDKKKIESQLHGEVLETAKYSEISFQSTKVSYTEGNANSFNVQIEGDLTLHGVKNKVSAPAKVTMDGGNLRATGQFEIKRKDYKIETPAAGGGTVKVSNELDITFDLLLKQ